MGKTTIEWCDYTFNPWIGCTKVSAGCTNCYAETLMDTRWGKVKWGKGAPRKLTSGSYWRQPLKWDREAAAAGERRRVFCASLADIFDEEVPDAWRHKLMMLTHHTRNLDWLFLTKRPEKMHSFMNCPPAYQHTISNIWLGVSVEDQKTANERIPILLETPAPIRFVSYEPAIGPVDFLGWFPRDVEVSELYSKNAGGINWIICGGESGHRARPFDIAWARKTIGQCRDAEVSCFVKQLGSNPRGGTIGGTPRFGPFTHPKDSKGKDPAEWPDDLRIREFPQPIPLAK